MQMRVIAIVTSIAFIAIAATATKDTYRFAPVFLIPILWGLYSLRRRANLHPVHFTLFAIALLMHSMGAYGWYQRGLFGVSFDVYVHFYFGLVGALILYRAVASNLPIAGWMAGLMTVLLVMGIGAIHELYEYASTLILGEEKGMLKTTGYKFDTQRDLLSNLAGALIAMAIVAVIDRLSRSATEARFMPPSASADAANDPFRPSTSPQARPT